MTDLSKFAVDGALRPDALSGLNPQFASALTNMFAAAPPEVQQNLRIMSAYRSPEVQQRLYAAALNKYGSESEARRWVAPPGHSQHNHGTASDLRYLSPEAQQWAHANAASYGLSFPLANEAWHVELAGARGAPSADGQAGGSAPAVAPGAGSAVGMPMAAVSGAPGQMFGASTPTTGGYGDLAALFAQEVPAMADRRRRAEEMAAAEQQRRLALFSPA